MRILKITLFTLISFIAMGSSAASFDCARAETLTEHKNL